MLDWNERIRIRLARLRLDPTHETDLVEELSQHLEDRYRELLARGSDHEHAFSEALRELSDVKLLARELRHAGSPQPLDLWSPPSKGATIFFGLWHDFRIGLRSLRRDARLAFLAVFTLALGIGATTIVFSILDNVLLQPFPYKNAGRLAKIYEHFSSGLIDRDAFPPEEFSAFNQQSHSFQDMIAVGSLEVLYTAPEGTQQAWGAWVSPEIFDALGIKPLLGRSFTHEDGEPAAPPVFAISHRLWTDQFGGDSSVLGKAITLNSARRTLVAVLPPRFRIFDLDIWMPLNVRSTTNVLGGANVRAHFGMLGHLKPGVSLQSAATELDGILQRYEKDHPQNYPERITILLKSFTDSQVGDSRGLLLALMGAVTLLLLIACSNVGNLLLARATVREKDIALRAALGAGRARLIRQLLVESLLLASAGCIGGCALAYAGLRGVVALIPADALPSEIVIGLNPAVISFSVLIACCTTLLCGLAPVIRAARPDLLRCIAGSSKGASAGSRHGRFRDGLVVAEIALSIVLLAGSGLMMRSILALRHVELGFNPDRLLWMRVALPAGHYDSADGKKEVFEKILAQLAAIPGVTAAAETYAPPSCCTGPSVLAISGKDHPGTWYVRYEPISADYFKTIEIPLLRGRSLSQDEIASARRVAVINQAMVRTYFAEEDPIGQRLELASFDVAPDYPHNAWFEIVGVVADAKNVDLKSPAMPEAYIPYTSFGRTNRSLLVRTAGDPMALLPEIRRAIWSIEPAAALPRSEAIEHFLSENWYAQPFFGLIVIGAFAGIGLALVVIGLFSLMGYTVALQTHEIGVRMALGAKRSRMLSMILLKGLRLIFTGMVLGVLASFVLIHLVAGEFWGVSPTDPLVFCAAGALLMGAALAACILPARRAMQVDPLIAIRYE